jgi:hypothetical protein
MRSTQRATTGCTCPTAPVRRKATPEDVAAPKALVAKLGWHETLYLVGRLLAKGCQQATGPRKSATPSRRQPCQLHHARCDVVRPGTRLNPPGRSRNDQAVVRRGQGGPGQAGRRAEQGAGWSG